MVWKRPCMRLVVSWLLGGVVLAEHAWGYHGTVRPGEWSLGTLVVTLIVLGAFVGLGLFFVWPKQRRHVPSRSVRPRGATKQQQI